MVLKFVCHSSHVLKIASKHGWQPGARYTNLRDVRNVPRLGFLDIDWRNYNFERHYQAAILTRPFLTVAQDIVERSNLDLILDQAKMLQEHCRYVVIVPKDISMTDELEELIPPGYLLGYSVPTRYGGTIIPPEKFRRPVHLLGGRPDRQRQLAERMPVVSLDCNRFTYDASFGDHFDGETFRPHPVGGYERCISSSLDNINSLWYSYQGPFGKWHGNPVANAFREWKATVVAQNV